MQKDIQRIEKVQKRAARLVTNSYDPRCSISAVLEKLGWKSLEERRKNQCLIMMFKIVTGGIAIPREE